MRAALCLVVVLLLGGAQGATSLDYFDTSDHTPELTQQAGIAIKLGRGPAGATAISVNETGAKSTVVNDGTFNTTWVNNTSTSPWRVRLTHVSTTNIGTCKQCDLEFRRTGGATSTQIKVTNGAVAQSQGAWLTTNATGVVGDKWNIYAVFNDQANGNPTASMGYTLEIVTTASTSPSVVYHNMTMDWDAA